MEISRNSFLVIQDTSYFGGLRPVLTKPLRVLGVVNCYFGMVLCQHSSKPRNHAVWRSDSTSATCFLV